jgi:hypothetical protein
MQNRGAGRLLSGFFSGVRATGQPQKSGGTAFSVALRAVQTWSTAVQFFGFRLGIPIRLADPEMWGKSISRQFRRSPLPDRAAAAR